MSERVHYILEAVEREVHRAEMIHDPMRSPHEAYAILKEEVDELWDEVKKSKRDKLAMRRELVQVAAMAARAIHDLDL